MLCICIYYSEESTTIIVMRAFGALPIKSVSRTRLMSAGRFFLKADQRKILLKAKKQQLINILAPYFANSGMVVIREGNDIGYSSSNNVVKEDAFHPIIRCKHHYCIQAVLPMHYALH